MCASLAREEFGTPGYRNKTNKALNEEICRSLIGTSYDVCCEIWNLIDPSSKERLKGSKVRHLFWALLLLKCYCIEPVLIRVVGGVDAGTFRKWSWLFAEEIAALKSRVIVFKHRSRNWNGRTICLVAVDGIDCPVQEQYPFDEEAFSQKFNGPGYKYEVAICIATCQIVWINGPFKAGRHDKTIFDNDGLLDALAEDECVETDGGYQGHKLLKTPGAGQTKGERKLKDEIAPPEELRPNFELNEIERMIWDASKLECRREACKASKQDGRDGLVDIFFIFRWFQHRRAHRVQPSFRASGQSGTPKPLA
jgi:hypothetical protein